MVVNAFNPSARHYGDSIDQLADMMFRGHEIFASGKKPKDGDPESDRVIWGHTQASRDVHPEVLAHFIVCHYLARYASYLFGDVEALQSKDGFIAALIDGVLLEEAKKPGSSQVLDTWMTPREEGGLGWIVPEYLDIYREVLSNKEGDK